jgi:hypothetical protein
MIMSYAIAFLTGFSLVWWLDNHAPTHDHVLYVPLPLGWYAEAKWRW